MPRARTSKYIMYIFQGGGALGAYQVGLFQALSENGYEPDCVGGSSIGAINASIIAGNQPKDRIPKLKAFWNRIATTNLWSPIPKNEENRRIFNYLSANQTAILGQAGFFLPRLNPLWIMSGRSDEISFYNTDPLRETLEELVNFDLINTKQIGLSLQAVEISCGKPIFFDNTKQKIDVRHIMASGALPPGFPAVKIDDKYYWDGGVISQMPFENLLGSQSVHDILCFSANLFDSFGLTPCTLDDVIKRYKDLYYSSRYHTHIEHYAVATQLRCAIQRMYKKLPEPLKKDPEIQKIRRLGCFHTKQFVRFFYTANASELSSKDYEFSKLSIDERMEAGYQDGLTAIKKSPWLKPVPPHRGVAVYDISDLRGCKQSSPPLL